VRKLREKGLSTRAIAEVVGVSKDTVARALASGVPLGTPEEPPTPELPPRLAKVQEMKEIGRTDEEVAEELGVSTKTVQRAKVDIAKKQREAAPKVVGRDGKQHPATKPEADHGRAILLAHEAINVLMRISPKAPRRARAFQMVRDWMRRNP
jgi:transposase